MVEKIKRIPWEFIYKSLTILLTFVTFLILVTNSNDNKMNKDEHKGMQKTLSNIDTTLNEIKKAIKINGITFTNR